MPDVQPIPCIRASDIPRLPPPQTSVKVTRRHVTLYPPKRYGYGRTGYWFDRRDVREPLGLVRWLHHLHEKKWFDERVARLLIEKVCEANGWSLHPTSQ